jgi:hypothetical protein
MDVYISEKSIILVFQKGKGGEKKMKIRTIVGLLLVLAIFVGSVGTAAAAGDAHGPCDEQRDDDGDGIPNCEDDDYVPPQDGDGYRGASWKD